MKKRRLAALAVAVIVVALMLEAGILKYVNDKMTYRISEVMLDRVFTVLEKNDQSEADMIESLKSDYIVLVQIHRAHIFLIIFVENVIQATRTVRIRNVILRIFPFFLHIRNPLSARSFRNRVSEPCRPFFRGRRAHGRRACFFREG